MTLTELKYIVTLAAERHFGRAAEKCFVSQPTLSVAVKKLEEELGLTLFERSKSHIALTETGSRVIEQAKHVLDQVGVITDIVHAGKDQLSMALRVGAIFTVGPYLFPHLIPELRRAASGMPLYIEENYTSVLREKLRHAELDAIIVALPFEEPDVVTLSLYDEPFVVLMPANHPLARFSEIRGAQLPAEDLLLLGPGHCFRDQVLAACPEIVSKLDKDHRRIPHHVMTEGSSLETIRHMVASGLGITVIPLSAYREDRYAKGLLVTRPFAAPVPFRTIGVAWRVTFPRPKAIDMLALAASQCRIVEKSGAATPKEGNS